MLRICKTIVSRNFLQPRALIASPPVAGAKQKQSIEEKLGFPSKPKRPLTPYMRFLAKVRPLIAQKHPEAKVPEIAKLGGEHWAKAEPSLKQQLEEEYRKEFHVYRKQMGDYENSLTEEQKEQITKAQDDAEEAKERRKLRRKMKDLGKPKRPLTAYMIYLRDNSRKETESYRDFQVRVAKQWEQEDEKVKANYTNNFNKQMEVYRRELQEWEEKMIRLGNIDVVRNEVLIEPRQSPIKEVPYEQNGSNEQTVSEVTTRPPQFWDTGQKQNRSDVPAKQELVPVVETDVKTERLPKSKQRSEENSKVTKKEEYHRVEHPTPAEDSFTRKTLPLIISGIFVELWIFVYELMEYIVMLCDTTFKK
ncbi:Mobility group protein 1A [Gryllus bimaculatus]|nr:Mobility group protein 1A [Gryllus bimaculatus]